MLIQLIYSSRAVKSFSQPQINELLRLSRINNQRLGITGMLVNCGDVFMQALEGEDGPVTALFEKISRDPRHNDIQVIAKSPIREKSFSNWTMGFLNANESSLTTLPGAVNFFGAGFSEPLFLTTPSLSKNLLLKFRDPIWRQKVENETSAEELVETNAI